MRRAGGDLVVHEEGGYFAAIDPAVSEELRREGHAVKRDGRGNLRRVDVNDDELVKRLADDAVEREAYAWDVV